MPLIKTYMSEGGEKLFRFSETYCDRASFNKYVNRGLKVVGGIIGIQGLTTYHARHSWATIARNTCRVSKDDIAICLNHASENRITDIYIKKDFKIIDEANRKVLDVVSGITPTVLEKPFPVQLSAN